MFKQGNPFSYRTDFVSYLTAKGIIVVWIFLSVLYDDN